jgi:hypothetical protein
MGGMFGYGTLMVDSDAQHDEMFNNMKHVPNHEHVGDILQEQMDKHLVQPVSAVPQAQGHRLYVDLPRRQRRP